jgi:hypothetical protein
MLSIVHSCCSLIDFADRNLTAGLRFALRKDNAMTSTFKIMSVSVLMMATPAFAQADPHAGHHPAGQSAAPKVEPAVHPRCPMMEGHAATSASPLSQGGMPMKKGSGHSMMSGMSPEMMKKCMADRSATPAEHPHGH